MTVLTTSWNSRIAPVAHRSQNRSRGAPRPGAVVGQVQPVELRQGGPAGADAGMAGEEFIQGDRSASSRGSDRCRGGKRASNSSGSKAGRTWPRALRCSEGRTRMSPGANRDTWKRSST